MNLSFIKLDINIMNDTKIKLIRRMPDGDSVLILWIGLLCLAMKSGRPGVIEIGDGIPFTAEALSVELDIPINTVRLGLKSFIGYKMIELWETGETYIRNFEKHQELTRIEHLKTKSRISSQKHREKLQSHSSKSHVTVTPRSRDHSDKNKDKEYCKIANRTIVKLNLLGNKNFRDTEVNKKFIIARLKENFSEQDCIKVLEIKLQDPFFKKNPRLYNPQTLFRASNFEKYLNEENKSTKTNDENTCDLQTINQEWLKQNEYRN